MKLAVVMTYYNEIDIVGEAVDALVANDVPLDLYLVDDCADIPPHTVLDKYGSEPWLHYIRSEKNQGGAAGLNTGIKQAIADGAELIAINDADDISHPNRFKTQIAALEKDPELEMVGGWADMTDFETGNLLWREEHPTENRAIRHKAHLNAAFVHSTVIYRARVFDEIGYYNTDAYALDYDFACRVLKAGKKAANVPEVVLTYNIRAGSMSVSKRRKQVASRIAVQWKMLNPINPYCYLGLMRSLAAYLAPNGAATGLKTMTQRLTSAKQA